MGLWLKQSTAVTVKIGPFVDETDGKTAEVGLAIAQADVRLSKNGGDMGQKNDANACVHDEIGYYDCQLNATDTGTLGRLQLMVHESGALPVFHEFMIVTANTWDTFCGADTLQADLTQMGGVAQSATDLKDFADAGYDPATDKVQGVVLTDTVTAVTNDVGITQAGADKAWGTAARALTDKSNFNLAANQGGVTIGTVTNVTNDVGITQAGADKAWNTAARALTDKAGFSLSAAGIDSIVDEVIEGTLTLRQAIKLTVSMLASKSSGGGTNTLIYRDYGDTKARLTFTVDASGNRSNVVRDVA